MALGNSRYRERSVNYWPGICGCFCNALTRDHVLAFRLCFGAIFAERGNYRQGCGFKPVKLSN